MFIHFFFLIIIFEINFFLNKIIFLLFNHSVLNISTLYGLIENVEKILEKPGIDINSQSIPEI